MRGRKRTAFCGFLIFCLLFTFAACAPRTSDETPPDGETPPEAPSVGAEELFLTIGSKKISVKLEKNAATAALIGILEEGDVTYTAHDYGGFEKVGDLGRTLPRNDTQMTTGAGDVILYSGDQIVLFYGSNSWSYTNLGAVQGISEAEWRGILTADDEITVTLSLR